MTQSLQHSQQISMRSVLEAPASRARSRDASSWMRAQIQSMPSCSASSTATPSAACMRLSTCNYISEKCITVKHQAALAFLAYGTIEWHAQAVTSPQQMQMQLTPPQKPCSSTGAPDMDPVKSLLSTRIAQHSAVCMLSTMASCSLHSLITKNRCKIAAHHASKVPLIELIALRARLQLILALAHPRGAVQVNHCRLCARHGCSAPGMPL